MQGRVEPEKREFFLKEQVKLEALLNSKHFSTSKTLKEEVDSLRQQNILDKGNAMPKLLCTPLMHFDLIKAQHCPHIAEKDRFVCVC